MTETDETIEILDHIANRPFGPDGVNWDEWVYDGVWVIDIAGIPRIVIQLTKDKKRFALKHDGLLLLCNGFELFEHLIGLHPEIAAKLSEPIE